MTLRTRGPGPLKSLEYQADRVASNALTGLTASAAGLIVGLLVVLLIYIGWFGRSAFSVRFLTAGSEGDMFDVRTAGVLPMIVGTSARVFLMSILVLPVGVLTAIYLSEYTRPGSFLARLIRGAVSNLAGVPSIVFGLFGLGFFVGFLGGSLDELLVAPESEARWGKPCLFWASCTLAVMTLPVVIVTTEEALRNLPSGLREGSYALGATRLQTVFRVLLPAALPGILTGIILAVSRAAGEVAPILFTGAAYYMAHLPTSLTDQFMDLGYHAFVLSTQAPSLDGTRPVLYATVLVLVIFTLALNGIAMVLRARMRRASEVAGF